MDIDRYIIKATSYEARPMPYGRLHGDYHTMKTSCVRCGRDATAHSMVEDASLRRAAPGVCEDFAWYASTLYGRKRAPLMTRCLLPAYVANFLCVDRETHAFYNFQYVFKECKSPYVFARLLLEAHANGVEIRVA